MNKPCEALPKARTPAGVVHTFPKFSMLKIGPAKTGISKDPLEKTIPIYSLARIYTGQIVQRAAL
ncbi:MAG: hypothetical protein CSA61_00350 [Neptuniibacter caesariensis]|uniref:Uncharacterized protein n=1 Tax=Neptuniibacter caesariensis TaxID=207954 RepID=A0A2G6JB41_NEPCE|nr:MAG: hypothetical protein CSA61_00350 [Neptuniibacter caesariensis]